MKRMRRIGPIRLIGPISPIGLIGLIGLIGCSSDPATDTLVPEPVPAEEKVTGTPIVFNAQQDEQQTVTRAVGLETKVNFFEVYGFKNTGTDDAPYSTYQQVIPGYVVNWVENSAGSSTTNTHNWEYVNQQPLNQAEQTIKYWDWTARAYRFFGVAGASRLNPIKGEYKTHNAGMADEYQSYDLTFEADASGDENKIPYYSHLWFSNGNTTEEGMVAFGQPVQLEFIKPLSKVHFIFIFEDPAQAKTTELTGQDFRPTSGNTIKMKGKVTVIYPLTGTSTKEAFSTSNTEPSGLTAMTKDYYKASDIVEEGGKVIAPYYGAEKGHYEKVYSVFPATGQGSYTLKVKVNGEPKTTIVPAEYMDWLPGYSYTYIFKIHVDGSVTIDKVQSAFTTWTEHNADHIVYNW